MCISLGLMLRNKGFMNFRHFLLFRNIIKWTTLLITYKGRHKKWFFIINGGNGVAIAYVDFVKSNYSLSNNTRLVHLRRSQEQYLDLSTIYSTILPTFSSYHSYYHSNFSPLKSRGECVTTRFNNSVKIKFLTDFSLLAFC